jgi:hypothetical protein
MPDVDVPPGDRQLQRALRNGEAENDVAEPFETSGETPFAQQQRRAERAFVNRVRFDRYLPSSWRFWANG